LVGQVRSDQGSDFDSTLIKTLHTYLGIPQGFSLIRRHESSGVERTNREIRRHVTALLADEELYGEWSDETVLPLVQYFINSAINAETGATPFDLHYGTDMAKQMRLPESGSLPGRAPALLAKFDEHLQRIRELSREHLQKVWQERAKRDGTLTRFQPGDFVLYDNRLLSRRNKTTDALWAGPFKVLKQDGNTVSCEHANLRSQHQLHVGDLKLFRGSDSQAERVARFDKAQSRIVEVLGHSGEHHERRRKGLDFFCKYEDGTSQWHKLSDIQDVEALHNYCDRHGYLRHLTEQGEAAELIEEQMAAEGYPAWLQQGAEVYVDMRAYRNYYVNLDLPDLWTKRHFFKARVSKQASRVGSTEAEFQVELLLWPREKYSATALWVRQYVLEELPEGAVLVDATFARQYPQVMEENGKLKEKAKAKGRSSTRVGFLGDRL
jgi:hypothetical protein